MGLYDVANGTPGNVTDLDQIVDALSGNNDVGQIVAYQQIAVPGAPTVAVNAVSGNLTGNYQYAVAFGTGYWQGPTGTGTLHAQGNTGGGTASAVVSPNAQQVSLSAIPIGPVGVVQRFIYRTKANGTAYFLLTVLSDNTTTSFTDNISDANLGAAMPTTNSTGTLYKLWNATADTITVQTINATSQSEPIVLPNLSAFPPIGPSGAFIIVQSGTYVSNGTSWVNPMVNLMMFSTAHGGTADFYGPTTIHGGVGLTVKELPAPSGLSAANATSGAVGANIAANTTYTYELTAVSYSGTETNASASVSITTGATAYPINLTWTNGGADVQFYNVYKDGNFLIQVAGTASSYQDTGNTATTARTPPPTNQTGTLVANGPVQINNVFEVPVLSALPTIVGTSGTVIVVSNQWYISNGSAWVAMATIVSEASPTTSGTVEVTQSLASGPPLVGTIVSTTTPNEVEVTGTTAQTVLSYTPSRDGNFCVGGSYRLAAAAQVTINILYTDGGGTAQTVPWYTGPSGQAAGTYWIDVVANFFATTASAIEVQVTCTVANACWMSCNMEAR